MRKNEFLLITLKHLSGLTGHGNPPVTPKRWAIAHEKGRKTRKRRLLCHAIKHLLDILEFIIASLSASTLMIGLDYKLQMM